MPRIAADPKVIDAVEKTAREVFGATGILPLSPNFVEVFPGAEGEVTVFLHRKPERNPIVLQQIFEAFKNAVNGNGIIRVRVIPSDEKLWRKF